MNNSKCFCFKYVRNPCIITEREWHWHVEGTVLAIV